MAPTKKKAKKNVKAAKTTNDKNDDGQKDEGVLSSRTVDLWDGQGEDAVKITKKIKPSIIPAVEVEPPGCSFNPAHESHQDALALAVADEMEKIYRDELGPEPVPVTVPGEVIDEEEKYFLDADGEDEDDQNENLIDNGDADPEKRAKSVTRVEMNRRIRRKEQLRAETEAKKVEKLSKGIDCLPDLLEEIAKEDEEKRKRHLRRIVAKKERLKACPPRLGKHKFVPAPLQVLLSEEKTGSLRQLKGCCTVVKDRFKSLEKRGLVVPSKRSGRIWM
ncbi:ribosome biogenesis protein NOP53-like [Olea europaea var. sylvestris]|uniref:ribosome biogenesis protein NOP53-like n=1 Tax=Olea europaea var. sylvestris TaxID=158386 RepID=UPI000C1D2846|nr:ribosome biogenesis protein NOP53-like [Olea europaea var. sylvestris]